MKQPVALQPNAARSHILELGLTITLLIHVLYVIMYPPNPNYTCHLFPNTQHLRVLLFNSCCLIGGAKMALVMLTVGDAWSMGKHLFASVASVNTFLMRLQSNLLVSCLTDYKMMFIL